MKTKLFLCSAIAALLLPASIPAQQSAPNPYPPQRPNVERLREQLRNLPPAERRALMRELQGQIQEQSVAPQGAPQNAPGGRPFAAQPRNQVPGGVLGAGAGARAGAGPGAAVGAAGGPGAANRVNAVLTPEQRRSLREVNQENQEKIRELQEDLREAREAVTEATVATKFKESDLRKKLQAAAKIETELAILRAKALSKIEPPLTAEQIEQIKNPPPAAGMLRNPPPEGFQQPGPNAAPFRNNPGPAGRPGRQAPAGGAQRPPPDQF